MNIFKHRNFIFYTSLIIMTIGCIITIYKSTIYGGVYYGIGPLLSGMGLAGVIGDKVKSGWLSYGLILLLLIAGFVFLHYRPAPF